ncbi:hypothetical protein [Mucilaginibacter sp. HD30]
MSYRKKLAHIFLFAIAAFSAAAQSTTENGNYNLRTVVAPSATTASLGKFGEIPVSLYTGIPNISIPLYDLKDGGLSVPIGLSYHAGGVRVEEIASCVGIGWALNAGGMIGRQVRGKPDEIGGWVSGASTRVSTLLKSSDASVRNSTSINLENGSRDGEPDIYYYNFDGKSGKFLFDEAGNVYGYPATGVKIQSLSGSGFTITAEEGTVYRFDKPESVDTDDSGPVTTAWYLSKITSADGAKEITFTYEAVEYLNTLYYGETKYFLVGGGSGSGLNDVGSTNRTQNTHTFRLTRIDFSGGYVRLNYNNARQDIAYGADKSLDQIEVYNGNSQLIKKYDLAYSYFGTGGTYLEKRLKLTSVTEKNLTQAHPAYTFTYNEAVQILSRNTMDKDHWGYYNGRGNGSLIPAFKAYDFGGSFGQYNTSGADRNADTVNAKAFMLQKIIYPTGGETEFTFESNTSADPILDFTSTTTTSYGFSRNQLYSTVPSPYEEPEFTIPASGAEVKMTTRGLDSSALGCDNFHMYIIKDGEIWAGGFTMDSYNLHLFMPGGTYKLRFEYTCVPNFTFNYQAGFEVKTPNTATSGKKPVGGMRIKQMVSRPGGGGQPIVKKYRYEDPTIAGNSSGVLVNFPTYGYGLEATKYTYTTGGGCYPSGVYYYVAAQGTTNYPLATTNGSFVGYENVVEDMGAMGEVRHSYIAYGTPSGSFPFAPQEGLDWTRGSELKTEYLAWRNGVLVPAKTIEYGYTSLLKGTVTGYKIGRQSISIGDCPPYYTNAPYATYTLWPHFYALNHQTERLYNINDASKFTETAIDYTYDPSHYQLSQVSKSTSSPTGNAANVIDEVVTNKKYAKDYTFAGSPSGSAAQGIKKLQDLYVINAPIEEYTYRQQRNVSTKAVSNQRLIGGMVSKFRTDKPYPDTLYRLEIANPVALSTFGSGSALSSNAFVKNSAYKAALLIPYYDDKGNVLQQQKPGGPPVSYIYGYNKQYPVAEVKNATYQDLINKLTQTVIDQINGAPMPDANLRSALAPLRTMASAEATVFTYNPLVGVSSTTDPKGMITYNEYDAYGRLNVVRDKDNNIIKAICYNYKGEATQDCYVPGVRAIYARLEYSNYSYTNIPSGTSIDYYTYADMTLKFYSDVACTQPYSFTTSTAVLIPVNLIAYDDVSNTTVNSVSNTISVTVAANTSTKPVGNQLLQHWHTWYDEYSNWWRDTYDFYPTITTPTTGNLFVVLL